MIKPEDEVVRVTDKSCTKDEIVAKLLGWMQGSVRLASVCLNQYKTGVVAEHLPYMQTLEFPVNDQLIALRDEAQGNLYALAKRLKAAKKAKDEATYNTLALSIEEKDAVIAESIVLMEKEAQYRRDVEDEIDNGATSAFEYYPPPPENPNEPRYTIKSVDQWSLNKYGLSVIDFANSEVKAERFRAHSIAVSMLEAPQTEKSIVPTDNKPWLIPVPGDAAVTEGTKWITAARYFARRLVMKDRSLRNKRDLLAIKILQEFARVGVYKRGGKLPHDPATVKRALSNLKWG